MWWNVNDWKSSLKLISKFEGDNILVSAVDRVVYPDITQNLDRVNKSQLYKIIRAMDTIVLYLVGD